MRAIDYTGLPEHIQGAMQRYVEHRLHPGSFLTAVLSNDFIGAVQRADDINKERLVDIATWVWQELPIACWGSEEKVSRWLDNQEQVPNELEDTNEPT